MREPLCALLESDWGVDVSLVEDGVVVVVVAFAFFILEITHRHKLEGCWCCCVRGKFFFLPQPTTQSCGYTKEKICVESGEYGPEGIVTLGGEYFTLFTLQVLVFDDTMPFAAPKLQHRATDEL